MRRHNGDLLAADLLDWSQLVLAARVSADGTILDANDALASLLGAEPVGQPIARIVPPAQAPALARLLDGTRGGAVEAILGIAANPSDVATDYRVRAIPADRDVLVVAEPAVLAQRKLVEQVLELNADLIATRRDLEERRAEAERAERGLTRANERLGHLESIGSVLLRHSDLDTVLAELLRLVREALAADRAAILLSDPSRGTVEQAAALGDECDWLDEHEIASRVLRDELPVRKDSRDGSLAAVPLRTVDGAFGVLLVAAVGPDRVGPADLGLLGLYSDRIALAIARVRAEEHHRTVAEQLQRSLLPGSLPEVAGIELLAHYVPSGAGLRIGGDWYDAVVRPDGRLFVTIGDVAGHGLSAASAMGQLRAATRAYAAQGLDGAEVLAHLNELALASDLVASAMTLVLDPASGEAIYASAGHPPPLVVGGGTARLLPKGPGTMLGIVSMRPEELDFTLGAGESAVVFTDGLAERRDEPIDVSLARVETRLAPLTGGRDISAALLEHRESLAETGDDLALLVVTRT